MTCHRNVTRDSRVTTPVSHATTTTPHHTLSLAEVVGGWFVAKKSSIATTEMRANNANDKRMGDSVAPMRGVR